MMTKHVMSDLAIPPGEYLEEVLADLSMSKEEPAQRMGHPASKLSQIYNGTKRITEKTALQLEKVVGVPAHIWAGLESEYRLTLLLNKELKGMELQKEAMMVPSFCYKKLALLNEVPKTRKPQERFRALQRFFGVTSLTLVATMQRYQAALPCASLISGSLEATAAWLRFGERRAQRTQTNPFDKRKLRAALKQLRCLTSKKPEQLENELRDFFSYLWSGFGYLPPTSQRRPHTELLFASAKKRY